MSVAERLCENYNVELWKRLFLPCPWRLWVKAGKIRANKKQDGELRIIDRSLSMVTCSSPQMTLFISGQSFQVEIFFIPVEEEQCLVFAKLLAFMAVTC